MQAIYQAHDSITGWCSVEKMEAMVGIVFATRPLVSLEIGVWAGKSLIPVAMAHKKVKCGKAIAVDPWKASESVIGQISEADSKWWNNQPMHDQIHKAFLEKAKEFDVLNWIDVKRMPSDRYTPTEKIGLLMIDGNHGQQAIHDVKRYSPSVLVGGFVVMDDLKWTGGAVSEAAGLLEKTGFEELYRVENNFECWAVFQRIK